MNNSWNSSISILLSVLFISANLELCTGYTVPSIDSTGQKIIAEDNDDKTEHATRLTKQKQQKVINRSLHEYNDKWCENCTNRFDMYMLFRFTDQIIVHGTLRRIYLEIGETYCPKKVEAPDCQFKSGFGWNEHLLCIFEVKEENNYLSKNEYKEFQPKCMPKTLRLLRMFIEVADMIHAEWF